MWNVLFGRQKEHRLEVPVSQGWTSASQGRRSRLLRWLVKINSNQSQPWVPFPILTCPAKTGYEGSAFPSLLETDLHPCFQPGSARSFPSTQAACVAFTVGRSYRADAINSRRNTSLLRRVHLCWIMSSVSLRTELLLSRSQRNTNEDAALGTSYSLSYT